MYRAEHGSGYCEGCMLSKIVLILSIGAMTATAQTVYTPEKGSAERTAILNSLRVPVEKELKQKIVFNVENLRVSGVWAFVSGDPQNTGGERPDNRNTG